MNRFLEKIILIAAFCGTLAFFLCISHACRVATSFVQLARHVLIESGKPIKKALFSPDNKVKNVLLGLIEAEREALYIAAYSLTDQDIAHALIAAHQRGIVIEIVADGGQSIAYYSKISLLLHEGIEIYSYYAKSYTSKGDKEFYSSLMHNKFIIFEHSIVDEPLLWTGSFNFTRSAAYKNQENVLVLQDRELVNEYRNHFSILKSRCKYINKTAPVNFSTKKKQLQICREISLV
jgi:phosphatidylserine/phosphatidylglycerophosphate/cardiolipin synthase-like enzyme